MRIMGMHAPDMVFANHTAGESAEGEEVARPHRQDLRVVARHLKFEARLAVRAGGAGGAGVDRDRDALQHDATGRTSQAPPSGTVELGRESTRSPSRTGLIKRKDVYSDSVSILRQVGLLD